MVRVISVVRDYSIYDRLVASNPCLEGCSCVAYDNRTKNISISVRYNQFLDSSGYRCDDWLVFCHEDFEFLENLEDKITALNLRRDAIYGVAGPNFSFEQQGCTLNSNKDGSGLTVSGFPFRTPKIASTVDCMCLIVNAEAINNTRLRFDENLSFDLYAEDFCIAAKEKFNMDTLLVPIKSQHYSWGVVGDRFESQYRYLCQKYNTISRIYFTTLGRRIGNGVYDACEFVAGYKRRYICGVFLKQMMGDGFCRLSIFRYKLWFLRFRVVDPIEWKKANKYTILP